MIDYRSESLCSYYATLWDALSQVLQDDLYLQGGPSSFPRLRVASKLLLGNLAPDERMDAHSSNGALVEGFSAALQEAESSLRRMGQLSFFTDDLFSELESHLASQEVSLMMPLISPEFAREATIKAMIDLARAADGSLPWDGWLDQARAVKNSLCEIALFYASRAAT